MNHDNTATPAVADLVLALIAREEALPLMDEEWPEVERSCSSAMVGSEPTHPASLSGPGATAVTLDALVDAEDAPQDFTPG